MMYYILRRRNDERLMDQDGTKIILATTYETDELLPEATFG